MTELRHAPTAGAQWLWRELSTKGGVDAVVAQVLAMCVASHHGGLIDCLTPAGEDRFGARMRKQDANVHLVEVLAKANLAIQERSKRILSDRLLVEGMRKVLKRISDREKSVRESGREGRIQFTCGLLLRMLFSCLIDADHTDTADFDRPFEARMRSRGDYPAWEVLIERLENHLGEYLSDRPIDKIRKRISGECLRASAGAKGTFSLTVPTGGGKTLASLRFALHHARQRGHDRIVYVVPYTTIIDQNAQQTREILEPSDTPGGFASIVLEHHSNLTPDEETPKSSVLSENWDAPVVYTTMVHLQEALFGFGTRSVRRMHQLANAVLIFDEIQTLPVNTVHLFCNAVNFLVDHCGSTVVLCTATRPLLDQVDADKGAVRLETGSEIISNVNALFEDLKRVEVVDRRKTGGWSEDEVVALAQESVRTFGSCLVIVNTKKAALSLYKLARDSCSRTTVCHLSTSMCPAHRAKILDEIGKRIGKNGKPAEEPGPLLCISTQLIEAGVDVDFASVIRFVAGLDSIAQAAGRCNRNGHREKGVVTIVNPSEENLQNLEDIRVGRDVSIRLLGEFADAPDTLGRDLLSPQAMERYFRYYFFERKHLMDYPVHAERDDTLLNMLSENTNALSEYRRCNGGSSPDIYFRQSFMSAAKAFKAIDSPTEGVIVPYGKEGERIIGELCATSDPATFGRLLRQAQRYTVNVFPWVLEKLRDVAAHEVQPGTGILHLDPQYYSSEFGLSLSSVAGLPFLNE